MAVNEKGRLAPGAALGLVVAMTIAAASCGGPQEAAQQPAEDSVAAEQTSSVDACALLSDAEVHAFAPSLGAGHAGSVHMANVSTCQWDKADGVPALMLQVAPADPSGLRAGLEAGLAPSGYSIEDVPGLGDSAAVAIQQADPASGIDAAVAMLVVNVGDRQLGLSPAGLAIRGTDDPAFHGLEQAAAAAVRQLKAGG